MSDRRAAYRGGGRGAAGSKIALITADKQHDLGPNQATVPSITNPDAYSPDSMTTRSLSEIVCSRILDELQLTFPPSLILYHDVEVQIIRAYDVGGDEPHGVPEAGGGVDEAAILVGFDCGGDTARATADSTGKVGLECGP
jgi:hypothetical protein